MEPAGRLEVGISLNIGTSLGLRDLAIEAAIGHEEYGAIVNPEANPSRAQVAQRR